MKSKLIIICLLSITSLSFAQSNIDDVLRQVSINNLQIKAGSELIKAKRTEFNIGLAPYDPFVNFDYLFGSPKGIGNQTEFSLIFSFDFPTVYGKRSTLTDLKSTQLNYDEHSLRQEILLETKLTLIELVYLNRKNAELDERYITANRIYDYFTVKLQQGDVNIMEVNKAKLQVINYKSELELNKAEITKLNSKLTELNGGKPIHFTDTTYPEIKDIPVFAELEAEIESTDPVLKRLNLQYKITIQEIDINKDLRLPKIELGYRYQGLLDQNYNGIHAGISIPLWEKNYTVKTKELQSLYTKSLIESHKNEHYYEIKQLYEQYVSLGNTLTETKELFGSINNYELYEKAFLLGEISSIEYLMEITYYYSIKDKINALEKEFYILNTKLLRHKL
jgi:outer membrane protein, heavy metal efflux system